MTNLTALKAVVNNWPIFIVLTASNGCLWPTEKCQEINMCDSIGVKKQESPSTPGRSLWTTSSALSTPTNSSWTPVSPWNTPDTSSTPSSILTPTSGPSSFTRPSWTPIRGSLATPSPGYEEIYRRFLNGRLIYRPNVGSDAGKIELPILALSAPLDGEFNLSQCGSAGQYLSINTGYRKGKKKANRNKLEIWFVPRFLIERQLSIFAGHFGDILNESEWPQASQIGVFWTWGGWENLEWYDYLTTNSLDQLGDDNLHKKYLASSTSSSVVVNSLTQPMAFARQHFDITKLSCLF